MKKVINAIEYIFGYNSFLCTTFKILYAVFMNQQSSVVGHIILTVMVCSLFVTLIQCV